MRASKKKAGRKRLQGLKEEESAHRRRSNAKKDLIKKNVPGRASNHSQKWASHKDDFARKGREGRIKRGLGKHGGKMRTEEIKSEVP